MVGSESKVGGFSVTGVVAAVRGRDSVIFASGRRSSGVKGNTLSDSADWERIVGMWESMG